MGIAGLLKDAAIYSSWFNSWNLAFTTIFWTSALIHFSRIPATIYIVFLCVVTSHEWILCTFIARTKLFGPQNYLMYGLNYFSPQKYSEPLSPNISNVILFGNRVFIKVIKLKRGLRGPYNNMTGVLIQNRKFGQHNTQREEAVKRQEEHHVETKDWNDAKAMPKMPANHQRPGRIFQQVSQGAWPWSLTPWYWNSSVQNCKTICFFFSKLSSL